MSLSAGAHHLAIITENLDRFVAFYRAIFEAELVFDMVEPFPKGGEFRHAMIDLGAGFSLHPIELSEGTDFSGGLPDIARRGHIDHLAINVPDEQVFQELRMRLVKAKACDGIETDYGSMKLVAFNDPDGMECEIAIWKKSERGYVLPFSERIRTQYVD